eukprot:NODE_3428_length_445_cov_249.058081_g2997_i0.p2 GENE.NODE_3428_length_445_cov_249.058081_g2997_i0~~NODE_3428_length_445_cov_249.058081_g2997_i0.p2  ORF type:complete len:122 (-),score=23.10 NODE_3428_length_445_cov_249.058081_g2997_i0:78-422(-)
MGIMHRGRYVLEVAYPHGQLLLGYTSIPMLMGCIACSAILCVLVATNVIIHLVLLLLTTLAWRFAVINDCILGTQPLRQIYCSILGMWLFIFSEIMLFGCFFYTLFTYCGVTGY